MGHNQRVAHGIEDVARAAGVSTATVSRALRGLPNVSERTRERVRQVAFELGYVPSPSASALASGRTRTIGLLTPWVNRWFFSNVIEGAERALRKVGFDALLYSLAPSNGRARGLHVDPAVLRGRVDGVLVVGIPLEAAEVASLESLGLPLVFVGSGAPGHVLVGLDEARTAQDVVGHLTDLGHRRIGHISGTPDSALAGMPPVERRRGWLEALSTVGVGAPSDWEEPGEQSVDGGRSALHRLLDRCPELTAVFAFSDEMAMGAILAAGERGLRVPQELSVVGVDGHELSELVDLTTMAQPVAEQGAIAATLVLELIREQAVAERIIYPATLTVRGSSAPPRG